MNIEQQQEINWRLLSQLLAHLRIVHHVQGRVRVRLLPEVLELLPKLNTNKPEDWLANIPGVIDLRLNTEAASLTIQYDSNRIQPQWWERLLCVSSQELPTLFREVGVKVSV